MKKLSVCLGVATLLATLFLAGCGGSGKPPISVALSPSTTQTLDQGQSVNITATLTNDTSNSGVTWSLTGAGTLANQTSTSVTYDAPSSVSSPASATITATSVASTTVTAQVGVTVDPAPQVTTTSVPAGTEGTAYSTTLAATGGTGAYTWAVSSGTLPTWAKLGASTGVISGTPNATGTANFSVTVTDAAGVTSAAQALVLKINAPPPLTISTTSLPGGTEETSYTTTLSATGGIQPYTWSIASGTFPAWANLNASTGAITGTPNASGSSTFTVKVTDSEPTPASVTSGSLTITIAAPPPLAISTTTLPGGTEGTSYTTTLNATGGIKPYTWSIASGSLPAWASLNASTGVISGMPNTSGTSAAFTVKVTDSEPTPASVTSGSLTITIAAAPALTISTTTLPTGTENTAYTATLAATGGVQPYTWAIASGSLPSWASLNTTTGVISGTPNATGTSTFAVSVTDSEATPVTVTSGSLTLTINAASGTNDSELTGQYSILLQGFDDATGHQFAIVGSFIADGKGNVSGGLFDVNGPTSASAVSVSSGSYSIGANNLGTLTLHGSDGSSRTFAIAVGAINSGVASHARIIEFDDTNGTTGDRGAGSITLQTTSAFKLSSITGPYAFQLLGEEGTVGSRVVNIGAFTADGSGNITNGEMDSNATGNVKNGTFTATLSTDANTSTFGRVTMTLGGGPTGTAVCYIVSANKFLVMTQGAEATNGLESGEADSQTSTSFTTSSLNGNSIFFGEGLGSTSGDSDSQAGLLQFNGSGSVTVQVDENDSGTVYSNTGTYSYTVAANGRVAINGGSGGAPIFYLIDKNKGFAMSTDSGVQAAYFVPQSSGPFTVSSISGNYFFGNTAPSVTGTTVSIGVATSTGNGTIAATQDDSSSGGTLVTAQTQSFTFTAGTGGRFTDSSGDVLWMISPTSFVVVPLSSGSGGDVTLGAQ